MKLKCNHCGCIFEGGIMNVVDHVLDKCGKREEVKINDMVSAIYSPPMSITTIEDFDTVQNTEE